MCLAIFLASGIACLQGCKFCKKTKQALKAAGIQYDEVEISRQPGLLSTIKSMVGHTTVPQVWFFAECAELARFPALQSCSCIEWHGCLPQPACTALPGAADRTALRRARLQVFVGGKFVGGSDATIKLLNEGHLLEQGDAAGSALPSDLQQAVDKANKESEACCLAHDLTLCRTAPHLDRLSLLGRGKNPVHDQQTVHFLAAALVHASDRGSSSRAC